MNIEKRTRAFVELGDFLTDFLSERKNQKQADRYSELDETVKKCFVYNGWFTESNVLKALAGIRQYLLENDLREFAKEVKEPSAPKTIAVIMAGNIPAVGFHDLLCVLLSGHNILIKLSSDDGLLIPFLISQLISYEPSFKEKVQFTEGKLKGFDAVIATGSDNSARYFKQYFDKYPHIIRRNRSSVAILSGKETKQDLEKLGHDIFDFFGLGCRSVSKLFVPKNYNFDPFYEAMFGFANVMDNKKYANNHDYQHAVYLLNQVKFLDNNFLIIRENESLHSPVSVIYYEYYGSIDHLSQKLAMLEPELQCVVTNIPLSVSTCLPGTAQCPSVFTFADNINTLRFLNNFG